MKTINLNLNLRVEFDPRGETKETLIGNLNRVVRNAVNNGTLTGETAATVEKYSFDVTEDDEERGHIFSQCEGGGIPRCVKCGCDEDDAFVGGEPCVDEASYLSTLQENEVCFNCGSGLFNEDGTCQKCGL